VDFSLYLRYGPALLSGFGVTLLCWFGGAALGLAVGFAVALLQRVPLPPLNWLTRAYIELVRGTPFLVQLFVLYDGGPAIGLRLEATTSGILALGVYGSAYFAEIFRAGFAAVPPGQVEAAASLGMAPWTIMWRVRIPVMLVAIVPALTNMLIILSKETVVLSIITVPELMYQMQTMAAETFAAFETILAMALLYWVMVEMMARLGRLVEHRVTAVMTGPA
jgi:polar amino acid transport system permease protein